MADGQLTDAYRCGQLYAALAALERLGSSNGKASLDDKGARSKASEKPLNELRRHVEQVVPYLMQAQQLRRGPQAAAVFRAIPELLPHAKELPAHLSHAQREDFHLGWCAQVKALEGAAK
ncbi:hypothetical protein AB0L33_15570 [Streptomyces sp. NPDC052299]|uniref:hypothetical protein n=1 Tax=Streptomyces sp. NPDC052299 TaxID=3155054 RepID=UPI0034153080